MNYKIRVKNEAESKEAQELFFEMGYKWIDIGAVYYKISPSLNYITAYCEGKTLAQGHGLDAKKEITIPQLKDMVVLKRNDPKDATHYRAYGKEYFQTCDKERYYHFQDDCWVLSTWMNYQLSPQLKPINKEPTMKEFLVKSQDGKWRLETEVVGDPGDDIIEVPEGADTLAGDERTHYFWKHRVGVKGNMLIGCGESLSRYPKWDDCEDSADEWLGKINCEHSRILWQRETLNDKVASAEVARQEFIGAPFSDLSAFNFGAIDDFVESNIEQGAKHAHYKKDISHLNTLDIYRVTELFNPHSCGAHIAKKALCSGQRGHKDLLTDIQDIIDTAERWKEMLIEDENSCKDRCKSD